MKAIAVEQAKSRLARAEKAVEALKMATTIEEAEEAWSDFLLAASTIYSKLEQGAKGGGKSEGWFGRKKKERKDDPLLRYLHYARNSDEHGIERVIATTPDNFFAGRKLKFGYRESLQVQQVDPATNELVGERSDAIIAGPSLKPIRVHDRRFNDYCDPPMEHQGVKIKFSDFCYDIGVLGLAYLTGLIQDAENLIPPPKP